MKNDKYDVNDIDKFLTEDPDVFIDPKKKHEEGLKKQLIDYLTQHAINSPIGNKFI